jgi:hypothetical protein
MMISRLSRLRTFLGTAALALVVGLGQGTVLSQANGKAGVSSTLHGDQAHPAKTLGWVDTELYFGLGPADDAAKGVSEQEWRAFLDKEVTPRFPAGLSVVDVYGQWQGKGETAPERIRSKELIIDYPQTAANAKKIEAIRVAWKQKTGDRSVMKVTLPAEVSF